MRIYGGYFVEYMTDINVLRATLRRYNAVPKKYLGQNFIIDREVIAQTVDALQIGNDDIVIEIGPGAGALTEQLCINAKRVIAIEIDEIMVQILQEMKHRYSNIEIIKADILKTDIGAIINKYTEHSNFEQIKIKIAGNLPYYITTPIIMGLLEKRLTIKHMVFMVQKEVAQRIVSGPGVKDYGVLSVMVQYYSIPSVITCVKPESFLPKPGVESAIIKLLMRDEPEVKVKDEKLYFNVVKAAFNQRRKTLSNAIANSSNIGVSKQSIQQILSKLGMSQNIRGEDLSPDLLALFSDEIYSLLP